MHRALEVVAKVQTTVKSAAVAAIKKRHLTPVGATYMNSSTRVLQLKTTVPRAQLAKHVGAHACVSSSLYIHTMRNQHTQSEHPDATI
jgi:hypothetical protein